MKSSYIKSNVGLSDGTGMSRVGGPPHSPESVGGGGGRESLSVSLLAVGGWFPPGTPVSSTTETDISSSSSPP